MSLESKIDWKEEINFFGKLISNVSCYIFAGVTVGAVYSKCDAIQTRQFAEYAFLMGCAFEGVWDIPKKMYNHLSQMLYDESCKIDEKVENINDSEMCDEDTKSKNYSLEKEVLSCTLGAVMAPFFLDFGLSLTESFSGYNPLEFCHEALHKVYSYLPYFEQFAYEPNLIEFSGVPIEKLAFFGVFIGLINYSLSKTGIFCDFDIKLSD